MDKDGFCVLISEEQVLLQLSNQGAASYGFICAFLGVSAGLCGLHCHPSPVVPVPLSVILLPLSVDWTG